LEVAFRVWDVAHGPKLVAIGPDVVAFGFLELAFRVWDVARGPKIVAFKVQARVELQISG